MKKKSPLGYQQVAELVFSVVLIVWYVLPYVTESVGSFKPLLLAGSLYGSPPRQPGAWLLTTILALFVLVICLWKIAAFFLRGRVPVITDPALPLPILMNVLSSALAIAMIAAHIIVFAASFRYFEAFGPATYVVLVLAVGFNAYSLVALIMSLSKRDPFYQEYLDFRRSGEDGGGVLSIVPRQGIQKRLILTFVPLILAVIVVLCFVLLRNFKGTIQSAVFANAESVTESAATEVKANPADRIALDDYFSTAAKKNRAAAGSTASFRFNTLSFYRRDAKAGDFVLWSGTDPSKVGARTRLDGPLVQPVSRYNPQKEVFEFLAPVTLSNVFIGYVMVDYARDVIYEPYYRTQVKVFAIAALFMYASVFLIYLFGRNIVFPILFLRMSVYSIADMLSRMIKGKERVSAELLQYKDRVTTRDEIKLLSNEVSNMTTVIRGVIPYISASTLKHSERTKPMTERKTLTFLFTDIRGFTSISESMKPDKVVEMLNHYLDLQASLIHANNGEIDKFVGDEIMAMFEGSKKDLNACRASLEIRKAMAQEKELAELAEKHIISIGIGINTGPVVFGSMGARERMDFTSIGDTVNLAARLEGTNKEYGTKTLITESVYEKVKDHILCREIDLVTVKGKTKPVRIYEVLQESKIAAPKLVRMKEIFESSLELYRKQAWDAAEIGFQELSRDLNDEPSRVFLQRIKRFREDPPQMVWDGVFHRTAK
ncbi:MAG TPA: adenylate/guanylate cyclase domain-containing protein [Spirochaetia bacterium]|nr:adenylate/guanylate cyclase domain-containing protein [Spirochaetia bacterium]